MANKNSKEMQKELSRALMNDLERVEYELATHWKRSVAVVVAVAVVIAAIFWGISSNRSARQKAFHALAEASTIEELNKAIETYGDSEAAANARMRLARMLVAEKKYSEAITELEKAIASDPDPLLNGQLRMQEASLQELVGKPEIALELYRKIAGTPELASPMRAEANVSIARLLLDRGELTQAVTVLDRIQEDPNSFSARRWELQAKQMVAAIQNGEYGPWPATK